MKSIKKSKLLFYLPIILLTTACSLTACNNTVKQQNNNAADSTSQANNPDTLESTLLNVHEITMDKIGALRQASADLTHLKDSLKLHSARVDSLISKLSRTDSAMFSWMQQFDLDKDTADKAKRAAYLQEQLSIVNNIKDSMLTGIDSANVILKQ